MKYSRICYIPLYTNAGLIPSLCWVRRHFFTPQRRMIDSFNPGNIFFLFALLYERGDVVVAPRKREEVDSGDACQPLGLALRHVLASLSKGSKCRRISTLHNYCGCLLSSRRFDLISETQTKAVRHCQNSMLTWSSKHQFATLGQHCAKLSTPSYVLNSRTNRDLQPCLAASLEK